MKALILALSLTALPVMAQQTIYRWLNPETGQYITTPTLPPYPIKAERPNAYMVNVDLDTASPAVKAAIEKREAAKAEELRKEQERAERKARREQEDKEYRDRSFKESQQEHYAKCPGPLMMGVKLGMNEDQVRFCLSAFGSPDKVNTTTSFSGIREQWVYRSSGNGDWYLYFSNGRLTSMQQ